MSVFCVDIGGTFTKFGTVSKSGKIVGDGKFLTPDNYECLLAEIKELYASSEATNKDVICLSTPCNYIDGALRGESYVGYIVNKDIVGDLQQQIKVKILIENDGNCGGLGEYFVGAARGVNNFVNVVVGSGIGGCCIIDGKLLKGKNNIAGDIGYMLLSPSLRDGEENLSFGVQGGTKSLIAKAQLIDSSINTAEEIIESKHSEIVKVKANFLRYIAIGIIDVMYVLDPDVFLLSGGISENLTFINELNSEIDNILNELSYQYKPVVKQSQHKNNSNLLGAAYLYYSQINKLN